MQLPDGFIAVVKRDCPTCVLIEPVLQALKERGSPLTVYTQDDPDFPAVKPCIDDRDLEVSWRLDIETVPTLLRIENGTEAARIIGWERAEWRAFTGVDSLGDDLPEYRPGCGSLSVEPHRADALALRFGETNIQARHVEVSELEDEHEFCFERGWSDGLPVVPPTEARVYRMLQSTTRDPAETLGEVPPNLVSLTVEKVAINAVMAGCKPEYLPTVLGVVEAALDPAFCLHGLLATTWFSSPMVVINGPVRKAIDMNWAGNVFGQGNRANATIGRALQLVVRNVGGGRPQETDMSAFGTPGKYTFCFAEDEDTPWQTLSEDRGFSRRHSTATVFSADGVQGVADQRSRAPEPLLDSIAASMKTVCHVNMVNACDVVVVVGPEHGRVFDDAGWDKAKTTDELYERLFVSGEDLGMGTDDDAPLATASPSTNLIPKFRHEGIQLIRAGGDAGLFSAIIPGWLMKGSLGTDPVTKEIRS